MIRHARSLVLALGLAFALPGAGHAQFGSMIDFINKLSGPETVGAALKIAVAPDRVVLRERANPGLRSEGSGATSGSVGLTLGHRWDRAEGDADAWTGTLTWEPRLGRLGGSVDLGILTGIGAQRWYGDAFDDFWSASVPLQGFVDVFLTPAGSRVDLAVQLTGGLWGFLLPEDAFEPVYPDEGRFEVTWGFGAGLKIGRFNLADALR